MILDDPKVLQALTDPRQAGEALKLFVDGVRDYAIILLTSEGIVSSWNLGAQRIKGYSADEIIGLHFSVFFRLSSRFGGSTTPKLKRSPQPDARWIAHADEALKG